ncbi:MAG: hypothetical protein CM15mP4_0430 [Candidatus Neomarinimicrobiota bacterium]|nr:MAG: hypothetical protein CM15mP4_0430 [Candidatus Neomarinimicrobiota bacterium]
MKRLDPPQMLKFQMKVFQISLPADGYAYGLELFGQKMTGNLMDG